MRLKIAAGGVPAGNYSARFTGVAETTHEKYGPGLRWSFEIASGQLTGQVASRTTSTEPTPRNSAGKMLAGICGGPLAVGQELDVSAYVDRSYLIVVEAMPSGGTAITTVIPAG